MFLPNSNSFLLVKSKISKPVIQPGIFGIEESATSLPPFSSSDSDRKTFLPNSHSFLLVRSTISKPDIQYRKVFLPNSHSFSLVRSKKTVIQSSIEESETSLSRLRESRIPLAAGPSSPDSDQPTINDKNKRAFLKVAGIAGAGLVGSLLLPKKADALIMGSSPTTGVVGVKNSTNERINPATEGTLAGVLKKTDLALTAGVLEVKVTSVSGAGSTSFSEDGVTATTGMVDAQRHVQVDVLTSALPTTASTETTLSKIALGGVQYALRMATDSVDSNLEYVGEAPAGTLPGATSVWRIKRINSASGIVIEWPQVGGVGTEGFSFEWDERQNYTYS